VLRRHKGVRLIGVGASNLTPTETPDLFEEPERIKLREVTSAVDQVRERFGFDAVRPASLLGREGKTTFDTAEGSEGTIGRP